MVTKAVADLELRPDMVPAFHAPVSGKPDAPRPAITPLLVAEADEGILSGDRFPLRPSNEHNAWGRMRSS